jgi:hypothetical protein
MDLKFAVLAVGKKMGNTMFHNYMGGAMIPQSEIGAAATLATIYGMSEEYFEGQLHMIAKQEFDKLRKEQARKIKNGV